MSHRARQLCLLIALLIGLICWWAWFGEHLPVFLTLGAAGEPALLLFAAAALIAAMLPAVQDAISRLSSLIGRPKSSTQILTAIAIAAVSTAYLIITAIGQHRPLYPIVHDEFSYLISAHQLASGRLWMPTHPLARFFDSFQLIVDPVYASAYFPGTAIFFAIAIFAHIPPWVAAVVVSGAVVGSLYWIVTELIDGAAGIRAALLLVSIEMFRTLSVMVMAQIPLMLAGELAVVGWLKWLSTGRARWAWLIGVGCGWAAIIRPVDALCFAIPIGAAVVWKSVGATPASPSSLPRKKGDAGVAPTRIKKSLAYIAIGVLPFLILQLISNRGVTGHWFETPFRFYADRDHPLTSFGFHDFDPSAHPVSDLPQKQALYFNDYVPQIMEHTPGNVPKKWWRMRLRETLTFGSSFPFPLLLPLLPVGLIAAHRRDWIILSALPLFVALYSFYVFFLPHYPIVIAPAVILGILLGARAIPELLPRGQKIVSAWLSLMIFGLAIAALPQCDRASNDEMFDAPLIAAVNRSLASLGDQPSVVLFRYDPARNVNEEPVYNADVAWPDDVKIIRAHDRGDDNRAIFRYYADHQPDRSFYLFDEHEKLMKYLGKASELASKEK